MIKELKKHDSVKLSDNFKSDEFDCKCSRPDCYFTYIDIGLIDYLETKRRELGKPFKINSGYRCSYHNKHVGGKPGSIHMQGKAADIHVDGVSIADLAYLFSDADGLGIYSSFVHVDVRGYKVRWRG